MSLVEMDGLRRRQKAVANATETTSEPHENTLLKSSDDDRVSSKSDNNNSGSSISIKPPLNDHDFSQSYPSYWLTRELLLRSLAFVYTVAFSVSFFQNDALIGKQGIFPYDHYLQRLSDSMGGTMSIMDRYWQVPTVLWWFYDSNDEMNVMGFNIDALSSLALIGCILSVSALLFHQMRHGLTFFILWLLYHSLVNVGQLFFGYGWETQLLETGFLFIFLCRWKLFSHNNNNNSNMSSSSSPPSKIVLSLTLWLLFRIMVGAGLIKIRGDSCWKDLSCMKYHYETQPVPNPLSWFLHNNPLPLFHECEVLINHMVELIVPFGHFPLWLFCSDMKYSLSNDIRLFMRRMIIISCVIQVSFQITLILSGNLSFLNWLTLIPALSGFDDYFIMNSPLKWMFTDNDILMALQNDRIHRKTPHSFTYGSTVRSNEASLSSVLSRIVDVSLMLLIFSLSLPVVSNLFSSSQIMNTSFDRWRIVNTYGAFGHVGKERFEVVMEVNFDDHHFLGEWLELDLFPCKPGKELERRPCLISPYHFRLTWQIWFNGFRPHSPFTGRNAWVFLVAAHLLNVENNPRILTLLDPSVERVMREERRKHGNIKKQIKTNGLMTSELKAPKFVRAKMYRYQFTDSLGSKQWWNRTLTQDRYFGPVSLDNPQFQQILSQLGWAKWV